MSIYTRRGDHGETSLADGSRVRKDSARVEAYGAVDEANSCIGLARAGVSDPHARRGPALRPAAALQLLGVALATPASRHVGTAAHHRRGRRGTRDRRSTGSKRVTGTPGGFVLEGGSEASARLHIARAILRRAERRAVTLAADEPVDAAACSPS